MAMTVQTAPTVPTAGTAGRGPLDAAANGDPETFASLLGAQGDSEAAAAGAVSRPVPGQAVRGPTPPAGSAPAGSAPTGSAPAESVPAESVPAACDARAPSRAAETSAGVPETPRLSGTSLAKADAATQPAQPETTDTRTDPAPPAVAKTVPAGAQGPAPPINAPSPDSAPPPTVAASGPGAQALQRKAAALKPAAGASTPATLTPGTAGAGTKTDPQSVPRPATSRAGSGAPDKSVSTQPSPAPSQDLSQSLGAQSLGAQSLVAQSLGAAQSAAPPQAPATVAQGASATTSPPVPSPAADRASGPGLGDAGAIVHAATDGAAAILGGPAHAPGSAELATMAPPVPQPPAVAPAPIGSASAAPTSLPAGSPATSAAADQVVIHLARALQDGTRVVTVQLHPAELGRVELKLGFQGNTLSVQMTVDRRETYDSFLQGRTSLERDFAQAGIDLGSDGLDLRFSQSERQEPGGAARPAAASSPQTEAPAAQAPSGSMRLGGGLLDILA